MVENRIYMDNTYMNVIRFGSGKKNLVVISGVTPTGLTGLGSLIEKQYEAFCEQFTVFVMDRKQDIPAGYHVADMADDVYRVLRELEVDRACVYGVSQGGTIAMYLALDHPELVEKVAVCSSFCRPTLKLKDAAERWVEAAKQESPGALIAGFYRWLYTEKMFEGKKDVLLGIAQKLTPEQWERFAILSKACLTCDISGDIDMIRCPVLVICDTDDTVVGAEGSYEIAEKTNGELCVTSGFGHCVYDENPETAKKVYAFFLKKK